MDGALPTWLSDELASVPTHARFLGVDGLVAGLQAVAAAHPDDTALARVGTSRQGEPLWCLTVAGPGGGDDAPDALVVGLPHPNEPIGGLTALHLADRLASDEALRRRLGHRWHVVACADPDGLRMNEGWLGGPFERAHYARHFYRPPGVEQVEWTFPVSTDGVYFDAAIAETQALMRLIDRHRPSLLASLHNSELGGAYYYLSRPEPDLHPVLQAVPESLSIPLDRGEPEAPGMVRFDDAIYQSADAETFGARLAARGAPWPSHGGSTRMYSAPHGTLTILSELPYWTDPAAGDASPTDIDYGAALSDLGRGLSDLGERLVAAIGATEPHLLAPDAPLWRAGRAFGPYTRTQGERTLARSRLTESQRPATAAELSSLTNNLHACRLRFGGMVVRALHAEVALGNVHRPVREHAADLGARYEQWVAEDAAAIQHRAIPIRDLVAVQYGATIAAAAHLAGTL